MAGTSAMALLAASRWESQEHQTKSEKTKRPVKVPPSTYEDNYNFGFSVYQPMMDYLDQKLSGLCTTGAKESPRLPYSDEMGFQSKPPRRTKSYSKSQISQLMEDAESKKKAVSRSASLNRAPGKGATLESSKFSAFSSRLSTQYSLSKPSIQREMVSDSSITERRKSKEIPKVQFLETVRQQIESRSRTPVRRTRSYGGPTEAGKLVPTAASISNPNLNMKEGSVDWEEKW